MPFPARDRNHSSASKGSRSKGPAVPEPLATHEEVVEVMCNLRICYRSPSGISCNPNGCSYVHDDTPLGHYRHVERQRRKASTPSFDHMTLTRVRGNLAALRAKSYGDRNQRPSPTGGSPDGDRPPSEGDVDLDTDNSNDEEERPNELLPTEPAFHREDPMGAVESPDAANLGNPHAADASSADRLEHQLWVKGKLWHTRKLHHRISVLCLTDTRAGGGLYMSMKLLRSPRRWGAILGKISSRDQDLSHAADPADSDVPTMRVRGYAMIPLLFYRDSRIQNLTVSMVCKHPCGLFIGACFSMYIREYSTSVLERASNLAHWPRGMRVVISRLTGSHWPSCIAFASRVK